MVRRAIDERRRALIRTVAAGVGFVGGGRPTGQMPARNRDSERSPMNWTADRSQNADFVVHKGDGRTLLSRRGADGPVFSGSPGAVLQRAIRLGERNGSGARIAVASGTYQLERPVVLASSTWISGAGSATELRASDDLDDDLVTVPTGADHVRISDLRIDGNGSANDRGDGIVVVGGSWRSVLEHLVVRDAAGHGIRFTAGPDGAYAYEPTLTDIDVARCAGDGFVFGYTGDLFGSNLYAEACGEHGFTMADAGGTLVHPHAYDTRGEAGIRVLESAKDLVMYGPHAEGNRRHGVLVKGRRITIRNAFVANNSRDAPDAYSGLVLDGARACIVSQSSLINDAEREQTQRHGIVETDASRDNVVLDNLFRGNLSSAVERPARSTGTRYQDNRGYRTSNGGEATVGDEGTIPHGLVERPHQYWVASTSPGTYAHVVDANHAVLVVEVLQAGTGELLERPVDVTWGAMAR
jgi:hypothetical protein